MKFLIIFSLILFAFSGASAQGERFVKPVDEAAQDASFLAFRTKLVEAAKKRDVKYVLSVVDKNIKNGFGGNDGIEEFKDWWKIESADSKFWDEFLPVITNGGQFSAESKTRMFLAPYSFTAFPEELDAFTHSVIFGKDVNLRAQPDTNAEIAGTLSYNIVEIVESVKDKDDPEKVSWYRVKTPGGKTGFVKADFVRSPIDYRAAFEKKNGRWKMTFFLAGD